MDSRIRIGVFRLSRRNVIRRWVTGLDLFWRRLIGFGWRRKQDRLQQRHCQESDATDQDKTNYLAVVHDRISFLVWTTWTRLRDSRPCVGIYSSWDRVSWVRRIVRYAG